MVELNLFSHVFRVAFFPRFGWSRAVSCTSKSFWYLLHSELHRSWQDRDRISLIHVQCWAVSPANIDFEHSMNNSFDWFLFVYRKHDGSWTSFHIDSNELLAAAAAAAFRHGESATPCFLLLLLANLVHMSWLGRGSWDMRHFKEELKRLLGVGLVSGSCPIRSEHSSCPARPSERWSGIGPLARTVPATSFFLIFFINY